MLKFTIETLRVDQLGNAQGHSEADAFYSAAIADAEFARLKAEAETTWRCFQCGEVCKSKVDAHNHFGSLEGSEPACQIKAAGEFALLQALRNAEERLQRYAAEDSDTLRAMASMQSDHQQALRREEEAGYGKAVAHMRAEADLLKAALRWLMSHERVSELVLTESFHDRIPVAVAAVIAEAVGEIKCGP